MAADLSPTRKAVYAMIDAGLDVATIAGKMNLSRSWINQMLRTKNITEGVERRRYGPRVTTTEKTHRTCLRCGRPFVSMHKGNRICETRACQEETEARRFYIEGAFQR